MSTEGDHTAPQLNQLAQGLRDIYPKSELGLSVSYLIENNIAASTTNFEHEQDRVILMMPLDISSQFGVDIPPLTYELVRLKNIASLFHGEIPEHHGYFENIDLPQHAPARDDHSRPARIAVDDLEASQAYLRELLKNGPLDDGILQGIIPVAVSLRHYVESLRTCLREDCLGSIGYEVEEFHPSIDAIAITIASLNIKFETFIYSGDRRGVVAILEEKLTEMEKLLEDFQQFQASLSLE